MEKLTIIGGSGYLGSRLLKRLGQYHVTSLDQKILSEPETYPASVRFIVGDARDPAVLTAACAKAEGVWIRAGILGGKKSADIAEAESYLRQNTELVRLRAGGLQRERLSLHMV